ncbi:MAG: LysR family transcriptional regulator [Duncaniella sp.]|nr:LysR family transcriptional regulator [Duncaniella sp.]
MELRQLKYFVKVAETLNFSEASKALFITQSTLSQQIKQLEQEFDTQLLQRNSHNVALTEAGEELLPCAIRVLQESRQCIEKLNDLKELLTGTLNIGVTYTFSPILTETLQEFMRTYPQVKLNIFYKPMLELMDMLHNREVDFVLAFRPSQPIEDVESHILFQNYLAAVMKSDHPLASNSRITFEQLESQELILPTKGLQARNTFEQLLPLSLRSRLNIRMQLNEVHILLNLIRQSDMITVLADATIHNEPGVKAIPLDLPGNEMEGCVHLLKNSYRKRSMQKFITLLSSSSAIRTRFNSWF